MNRQRIREILCVLFLVVFIVFISAENKVSTKSANEVFEIVKESMDVSALSKCNDEKFKEEINFSPEDFESEEFYASSSVMEVREIIIIKLCDKSQKDELMSALEKRVEEKINLFEGYAPQEAALLKNYVLLEKDGFVFFSVCDDAQKVRAAFKSAV